MKASCPGPALLARLLEGELSDADDTAVSRHEQNVSVPRNSRASVTPNPAAHCAAWASDTTARPSAVGSTAWAKSAASTSVGMPNAWHRSSRRR